MTSNIRNVCLLVGLLGVACDGKEKSTRTGDQGSPAQPGELPKTPPAPPSPEGKGVAQVPHEADPHLVGDGQPGSNDKPVGTTVGVEQARPDEKGAEKAPGE